MMDMTGQLIGKRFHARDFAETHGCDYLLANGISCGSLVQSRPINDNPDIARSLL